MSQDAETFGLTLYEQLRRLHRGSIVTQRMKFADVQRLKSADRSETLRLFHGSSYETIQHIKQDSPHALAAYLVKQAEEAERQNRELSTIFMFAAISAAHG